MKNLLVTGGCGFIGSNFINYYFYKNEEINIYNLDAMYYCADEKNIIEEIRNSDRYKLIKGNLCSFDLLNHILSTYKIDTIIHFAAQSHVQDSFSDSFKYTNDNILGTHTLLEASRIYNKITKFIHISTDYVFSGEQGLYAESDAVLPQNKYAWSKLGGEAALQMLDNYVIIRLSFGPDTFPYKAAFTDQYTSRESASVISEKIKNIVLSDFKGLIHIGPSLPPDFPDVAGN